jgi:hypothetical protein
MRIDGDASASLWAKRLAKLIKAIEEDGKSVDTDGNIIFINDEGEWTEVMVR